MIQFRVIVLAALSGFAVAAFALHSWVPGDPAAGPARTQSALSFETASAWQALRRPRRSEPEPLKAPEPQEQATIRADSVRVSPPVSAAAPSLDPVSLTRALQRELKRAGCYNGEINGIWTPSTRQAMKTYTDIANARLPVTNPDPVLLALLQGDQHLGCTARCLRSGKPGTCRDDGVVASSPATDKSAAASEVPTAAFLEPPMALAGPKTFADGEVAAPQKPEQKAKKRHNVDRSARTEHWSVKLWRESTN